MAGVLGADLVGMSTVLEAIAAHAEGCEVLGISLVTNLAAGLGDPLDHEEVLAVGKAVGHPDGRAARQQVRSRTTMSTVLLTGRGRARSAARAARAAARPSAGTVRGFDRAPVARRHRRRRPLRRRPGRGDGRRRRGRAPGRAAHRGAVADAARREHRGHVPGLRGGPPRRRAPGRLRVVQPRGRVHPGRPTTCAADLAAPPGHALRREQGLRRGARPLLRRPVRHAGRLPADRHLRGPAARTCARCPPGSPPPTAPGSSTPACARPPCLRPRLGRLGEHPPHLVARRRRGARLPARRTTPRSTRTDRRGQCAAPVRRVRRRRVHRRRDSASTKWRRAMVDPAQADGTGDRRGSRTRSTRPRPRSCRRCSTPATRPSSPTGSPAPLAFGTAGLRGPLRAGPNGMNRAVVRRAAAGLARWLTRARPPGDRSWSASTPGTARPTSRATRRRSSPPPGSQARLLPRVLPTPVLAFAVQHLGAAAGVMVTASHNPPQDNGYKVYAGDGAQIVPPADVEIEAAIRAVGIDAGDPARRGRRPHVLGEEIVDVLRRRGRARWPATGRGRCGSCTRRMHGVGTEVVLAVLSPRPASPTSSRCRSRSSPTRTSRPSRSRTRRSPARWTSRCALARDRARGHRHRQRPGRRPVRRRRPGRRRRVADAARRRGGRAARRRAACGPGVKRHLRDHDRVVVDAGRAGASGTASATPRRSPASSGSRAPRPTWCSATRRRSATRSPRTSSATRTASVPRCSSPSSPRGSRRRARRCCGVSTSSPPSTAGTPPTRCRCGSRSCPRSSRPCSGCAPSRRARCSTSRSRVEDLLPDTDGLRWRFSGGRVVVRPSGTEPKLKAYLEVVEPSGSAEQAQARLARLRAEVSALL